MKHRFRTFFKNLILFFLNPRLLLCFGLGWMITNGWSYLFVLFGSLFSIPWMQIAGAAWLAFLWFPFTPEKIITVALAIFFLRIFFPHDTHTLAVLRAQYHKLRRLLRKKHPADSSFAPPGAGPESASDSDSHTHASVHPSDLPPPGV